MTPEKKHESLTAARKLRSAVEQHEKSTWWGPDGAQLPRDEVLALLDLAMCARTFVLGHYECTAREAENDLAAAVERWEAELNA